MPEMPASRGMSEKPESMLVDADGGGMSDANAEDGATGGDRADEPGDARLTVEEHWEEQPKIDKCRAAQSTITTKKGLRLSRADGADIIVDNLHGEYIVMAQTEFNAMVRNISTKGQRVLKLRRYLFFAAFVMFILATVSFAMSWLAAETTKESHVEGRLLVNTQGETMEATSTDFKVNADGMLVKQCSNDGTDSCSTRRLSSAGEVPVTTTPTKHMQVLTSSLSDEYLMSLTEVVVYSDKGHTLRISVHGLARVPVANSRCGNIVHLYTAWNGRLTLDSSDLSFDQSTEAAFLNAGFSLVVGGVGGRRLSSQHNVGGFFTAVQGIEASEGWDCHDVPLPTLPEHYKQTLTVYVPCAVSGATGRTLDPCDSKYGGVVPGVAALPTKHQLALMPKAARVKAQLSVDVEIEQTLFAKTEVEILSTAGYLIQQTKMANHPGQVKVSVYNRPMMESVEFQLLTESVSYGRIYCNASAGDMTPQRREQEAAAAGVETNWHFEFLGMVEEDGEIYRHFRMMPDEAFLEWMDATDPSNRSTDAYYEFYDHATTLHPYRLINPDGSVAIFGTTRANPKPSAAEELFEIMGKGSSWDDVMTCLPGEQDEGEPMTHDNGMVLPKMTSPQIDLDEASFEFYVVLVTGDNDTDWFDNTTASNVGWDFLDKIIEQDGPLAEFAAYAQKSQYPLAMPDFCESFCSDELRAVSTNALAVDDLCATPGLETLAACVFALAETMPACGISPLAIALQECSAMEASATRRLSGNDEFNEEGDFEEEEEDNMKVTTIASGALKQAADPEPHMPVLSKLADGSNSLNFDDLDDGTRAQLAQFLNLESLPKTGRILFNSTVPKPGDEVKKMQGLADLPGIDSPAGSRRLFLDMKCLAPNIGYGCIFSVWFPKSGQPYCDPIGGTGSTACKYSLAVKIQLTGPTAGALSIGGSGCIEAFMFYIPKPFDGSICVAGTLTAGIGRSCGNKFPFTLGGYVSITAAIGLDFGLFAINAISIGVGIGAGVANYATQCWTNRRRRRWGSGTRRCNYACDMRVYGDARLNIGPGRLWARIEYWIRHKSFQMHLGADVCLPWPLSYCYCLVTVRVI